MEKRIFDLGGNWEFREFPETARRMRDLDDGQWMPARVPSSIYSGLMEAGCFSRFDLEANPEDFGWVSERAWVYRKRFEPDEAWCTSDSFSLAFDGLDTFTHIWLNDKLIGKTNNMFIPRRFDVSGQLRPGINTLTVKFLPAIEQAERLMQRYGKMSDNHYGDPRRAYIRKAQYQFGSVLGPSLPGCGIVRPVRLEAHTAARIEDVYVRTIDCSRHYADIRAAIRIERFPPARNEPLTAHLTLSGGGLSIEQTLSFDPGETLNTTVIRIERPLFWHPVGRGVPHLYQLKTRLCRQDGTTLDSDETDVGVRSIRLLRGSDRRGQGVHFEINDTPLYIKGANWIPVSMLPGSQCAADYERLLTQLKQAHINMLRVWGGGYYEDDVFYRLCDKLGILVWQDFAFASAYYPDRQWFMEMVRSEANAVVQRLRNHACLALWCGNSRIDHLHDSGRLGDGRKFYGRSIYHDLLPNIVLEMDPDRDYIPTTPFSEEHAKNLNAPAEGTCHHWDVWNGFAPTRDYLFEESQIPRFLAEFGLQSLPGLECLRRICPDDRWVCGSEAIEKHDYQADGSGRMARYAAELFRPPHTPDEQIEQTQLAQARAVKLCVEHLRANNHINSGLLLWTANDCSPATGFSAVDFCGQPKALWYYARRFFSPILVTLEQDKDAYLRPHLKGAGIVIVNDGVSPLTATVRCRCMDFRGQILDAMEYPVAVGPFSRSSPRTLPRALACPQTPNRSFLHLEVVNETARIAENRFYYLPDKYIDWPAAKLDIQVKMTDSFSWTVRMTSSTLVRDLTVVPPAEAWIGDNYIDLPPGQPRDIGITFKETAPQACVPLCLRSVPCGLG